MTNENKPTSKVIEISTAVEKSIEVSKHGYEYPVWNHILTVLCDDGSIFERKNKQWECILEAQINDK